jgi:hypothetical protein
LGDEHRRDEIQNLKGFGKRRKSERRDFKVIFTGKMKESILRSLRFDTK